MPAVSLLGRGHSQCNSPTTKAERGDWARAAHPPGAPQAEARPRSKAAISHRGETTKAKRKRKKARRPRVSRTPSKATLRNVSNMPRGYAWPPSEQMLAAERRCQADLDALGVTWAPAEREGRIVAAVTITSEDAGFELGGITYRSAFRRGPHKLDCQLALALSEFGVELRAAGVRDVTFGSIFRWTNVRVNGETKPILSRHALGIAMDIVSVTGDDGRVANVAHDYGRGDPLLAAVEEAVNRSTRFRVLLTPRNDPKSHHDHFHIEVAVDYTNPVASL